VNSTSVPNSIKQFQDNVGSSIATFVVYFVLTGIGCVCCSFYACCGSGTLFVDYLTFTMSKKDE
jgi:hypothetical protein